MHRASGSRHRVACCDNAYIAPSRSYARTVMRCWFWARGVAVRSATIRAALDLRDALATDYRGALLDVAFAITDWSPERRFIDASLTRFLDPAGTSARDVYGLVRHQRREAPPWYGFGSTYLTRVKSSSTILSRRPGSQDADSGPTAIRCPRWEWGRRKVAHKAVNGGVFMNGALD